MKAVQRAQLDTFKIRHLDQMAPRVENGVRILVLILYVGYTTTAVDCLLYLRRCWLCPGLPVPSGCCRRSLLVSLFILITVKLMTVMLFIIVMIISCSVSGVDK